MEKWRRTKGNRKPKKSHRKAIAGDSANQSHKRRETTTEVVRLEEESKRLRKQRDTARPKGKQAKPREHPRGV